jgi:hypothetical protein
MRETTKIAVEIVKCGLHSNERRYLTLTWPRSKRVHANSSHRKEIGPSDAVDRILTDR